MGIITGGLKLVGKGIVKAVSKVTGKASPVTSVISEIPSVGGAGSGAATTKPISSAIKNVFTKAGKAIKEEFSFKSGNPFTKTAKVLGGLTLGGYAATGNLSLPSSRTAAGVFGLATSPVSTVIGGAEGVVKNLADATTKINWDKVSYPDIPKIPAPDFDTPTMNFPSPQTNFNFTMPEFPSMTPAQISLPSTAYSPSINIGADSSSQLLPLLLLLGGGAALGGYAVGRRKRKKKKYKKRKNY